MKLGRVLQQEEAQKLIDMDGIQTEAIRRAENDGIIFLDEIDKIAAAKGEAPGLMSQEKVCNEISPYRGRVHGFDQIWTCQDRPHSVHRCRSLP